MQAALKPITCEFKGAFIHISLSTLLENLEKLSSHHENHFTEPVDTVSWTCTKRDGQLSGEKSVSELMFLEDLHDENTIQIALKIFKKRVTRNYNLRLHPSEFVEIVVTFDKKDFYFSATVLGEMNSRKMFATATKGLTLITMALPVEHQYLETFLRQFHEDHPEAHKNVFLIMRFQDQAPFPEIIQAIQGECAKKDLHLLRADSKEYTDDLWDNVLVYLYGCNSAIAVFDQINYREFNPNVALEIGFLLAQRKRVLLLKDLSIPVMPSDIVGKIYRSYNSYQIASTMPPQVEKWLTDYKIGE